VVWTLRTKSSGDAFAVDRVHPREAFRDFARLVGLQLANEMPPDRFEVPECVDLVDRFLDVVLTEVALSGRKRGPHCFGLLLLADGDQANALAVSSSNRGRHRDAIAHRLQRRGRELRSG
jgi:hypothetical protein